MRPQRPEQRQRGQIAIVMALAITALLGVTGVAVDLGFGYAHRRQVQNAADAGAAAGALALGRHIVYTYDGSSLPGPNGNITITDYTDTMILNEIRNAAAASAPPYPAALSSPSWPTGGNNALTANYMVRDPNDLAAPPDRDRAPRWAAQAPPRRSMRSASASSPIWTSRRCLPKFSGRAASRSP